MLLARALQIEHTGSTSVPKRAAKPIIDMLLVVIDSADENAYVPDLEGIGYVLRIQEPGWHEQWTSNSTGMLCSDCCAQVIRTPWSTLHFN